jgi:hypothetical protein
VQTNDAYRYVHVTAPDGRLYELVEKVDPQARELARLLADLAPKRRAGSYAVLTLSGGVPPGLDVLASVQEDEGLSIVVPTEQADAGGLRYELPLGWITLQVPSTLSAVGLTAAVSQALTIAGISCNVLAGFHHDHLLVPLERTDDAVTVLRSLSQGMNPA